MKVCMVQKTVECAVWYCEADIADLPSPRESTVVMLRACCQAQRYLSVIPALESFRREDHELPVSEYFIGRQFQTQDCALLLLS